MSRASAVLGAKEQKKRDLAHTNPPNKWIVDLTYDSVCIPLQPLGFHPEIPCFPIMKSITTDNKISGLVSFWAQIDFIAGIDNCLGIQLTAFPS